MDLSYKLSNAIAHYKDRMVRGLNAMCDDEKNRRIAEFVAGNRPENGTPEEMQAFNERLRAFKKSLWRLEQAEHTESLITTGGQTPEDEENDNRPAKVSQVQTLGHAGIIAQNTLQQTPTSGGIAGLYEEMSLSATHR
ncbi:MAG: hypothetical protein FWD97_04125 [Defluviitaleaceae bacterium]|nr:hypothetical protein [Defluviitaleaceae bacterium]